MKKLLLFLSIIFYTQNSFGVIFTVNSLAATNTGSGTTGTLRFCMNIATITPGAPHTIVFTVAGTIAIAADINILPTITSPGLTIDGTSAPGYAGVPVVIIDGTGTTTGNGITISTTGVIINALDITNSANNGISISSSGSAFNIDGCVLRNSGYRGISVNGASSGFIQDCKIGVNNAGTLCEMNQYDGIDIQGGGNNQILNNHIACNGYNGIQLGASNNNIIKGNIIGPLMGTCTYNGYRGIDVEGGSMNNIIGGIAAGEGNKIAGNDYWGIEVKEAGSTGNIISGNSMSCNAYDAIDVNTGGNNNIVAPVITSSSGASVSGTSIANAVIEIFRAQNASSFGCVGTPDTQGADYLGTTTATGAGTWTFSGSLSGYLVATQRTVVDGTSAFSNTSSTSVTPTWINGCSGPLVASGVAPIAGFNMSTDTICEGECIDFTDLSTNSPSVWFWTFAGGNPSNSSSQDTTACYLTAGTYSVTLAATNAFGTGNSTQSITVLPLPTITISQSGIELAATLGHVSYQWYLNGSIMAGETNDTLVMTVNGNYTCVAVGVNGCTDTSSILTVTNMGIDDFQSSGIKLYPNPASNEFTLVLSSIIDFNLSNSISLVNSMGQVVYTTKITNSSILINTSNISAGIYTYTVRLLGYNDSVGKLVVSK